MNKMRIGGVEFTPCALTFNAICTIEESGAPMDAWDRLDMSILRGYLAACLGVDAKTAGELIGAHIIDGGNLGELRGAFARAAEESDFFAALRNRAAAAKSESSAE